ncbi:hypothetical protein E3O25_14655 [Cryobacterium sp. TMT1-3]|uniref:Uncharacterized protein n=1 Tax=Cryobacterium luteum TaxID=1424661 RepID=A0A1H8A5U5_9MICO|nr:MULTISPECIES: hypothetical protein [Cryobacterium]TFB88398.1 hypothetical protein E3O10_11305 [Cryobacterium luteum]TFC24425.1 hypothetical protein E3O25_14655 [Cryobacterium sp. TMT1-3]SEM65856.1 hypothetical protein SAMN05216281_10138 [Cryobacterium luteum]
MPRELVIISRRPVDLADHLVAAVEIDPNLGLRTVWNGGGTQVCAVDGTALLTVLRTKGFDVADDVERLLGASLAADQVFWTELYAPRGPAGAVGTTIAQALAATVGGTLFQRSDP